MDAMPPIDLDRLLADTAFVRRIARSLVRDPDAAEDLAQDALVVALERPPRAGTSLRGWIATVVRSLAVDRARSTNARARREMSVAEREHAPGPDEIATRLDLSQNVARALRELEEPYRTALYLRYVEELDPPAIAARLDLPVATVKTQLRRGLEMLRRRFDREWGGRAAWSAVLGPWVADPAHAAPIVETWIVSTTTKIAAALLVCGAAAWVLWPDTDSAPLAGAPPIAVAADAGLAAPSGDDALGEAAAAAEGRSPAATVVEPVTARSGPFVRVLDERRFPVAGAHAVLHVPGLGDDETTTDAAGIARFVRLPGLESQKRAASVRAWDDRGRAGARACYLKVVDPVSNDAQAAEALRALGEIVLGPEAGLRVRVVEDGQPMAQAHVLLDVGALPTRVLDATADADGRVSFEHLPAKAVLVRAALADRTGRVSSVLGPGRDTELVVELKPTRTLDVTVVDGKTRSPIAGARLSVHEYFDVTDDDGGFGGGPQSTFVTSQPVDIAIAPTDAEGRTRVVGLPAQGRHQLEARADLHEGPQPPASWPWIPADSDAVTLELRSLNERSVRWPLEPGEVAAPPEGTALELRKATIEIYDFERTPPLPVEARIENGAVVADRVLDGMSECYAIAPGGSIARLWVRRGEAAGAPTSFRRPRSVHARVLDTAGRPAPGIELELRNQGNNRLLPVRRTDERGEATFEGLWGWRTQVCTDGETLGIVDLDAGDGRLEARLPSFRELSIRLRVDGEPGLPPTYRLWLGPGTRMLSEDPATGLVRARCRVGAKTQRIHASAPGFLDADVEFDPESHEVVDVDLRRGGALLAHVAPPRSGRVRLRCEAWDAEKQRWQTGSAHQVRDERFAPNAPDGDYLFRGLKPGRYRVRDVDAERSSEGVEVAIGAAPAEVALDLSNIVRIRGVIEVPPGFECWSAHVVVGGEGVAGHESAWLKGSESEEGHYVDKAGRFQVSVDTSRPVTLRAAHPYLSPDPRLGSVVVRGDTQDVRLALVAGDEVQIPLAAFGAFPPRDLLRVYAYRGEPEGEPHAWFRAPVVGDVARFSGLEHGTWTLWMDSRYALAPAVARGVVVGAGITRVEPEVTPGSSLRVRVLHAPGTTVPHVYVSAHKKAEPALLRDVNADGEDLVVVSGLGAGSYSVRMSLDEREPVERTIEFDGQTDVDIDFDVRDPKRP